LGAQIDVPGGEKIRRQTGGDLKNEHPVRIVASYMTSRHKATSDNKRYFVYHTSDGHVNMLEKQKMN